MSNASSRPSNQANPSQAHHKQGIVLAGLDQPQMIEDLIREYPAGVNGFSVPIYAIDPDQDRLDAIMASDLPSKWGSRVQLFAGSSCIENLCVVLDDNQDCYLPRHIIATGNHTVSLAKQAATKLDTLARQRIQYAESLRAALADRWNGRGYEYWDTRYRQISEGDQARVLVVTTRFSTFIRHSAGDLAESFCNLGHDVRLLTEPNTHTNITPILCLQAIEDFDPDLIVVINFPRDMHRDLFPDGCPYVCWIQDAMPHLFRTMERSPSPLDFVAGHIYSNAAGLQGYPEEARLQFPVPVSQSKFHPGPISDKAKQSKKCDIAYVSHQSQSQRRLIVSLPSSSTLNRFPRLLIAGLWSKPRWIIGTMANSTPSSSRLNMLWPRRSTIPPTGRSVICFGISTFIHWPNASFGTRPFNGHQKSPMRTTSTSESLEMAGTTIQP